MIIIGIAGKKSHGKDAVTNRILEHYPQGQRIAFADPLKDEVCRAMMIDRKYLEAHKKNFRLILQGWGTDYRREMFGQDYWTHKWMGLVNHSTAEIVIAPDVRFLNEALMIKKMGGLLFHVKRTNYSEGKDTHASETEMDLYTDFDRHLVNMGTLKQLDVEVDIALDMCGLLPEPKTK